ncbi:MAG: hypothetical protein AAF567_13925 [Actinomycetota bacterium]
MSLLTMRTRSAIPAIMRMLVVVSAALLVAAACSGSSEPTAVPQPTEAVPTPTATASVVTPPPTVTPVPAPNLDDDSPASVTTLQGGEDVVDLEGNLVTIHEIRVQPDIDGSDGFTPLTSPGTTLIDVSMCAAGEFQNAAWAGNVEFQVVEQVDDPLRTALPAGLGHAALYPAFAAPAPGACTRGWVPVVALGAPDADEAVARLVMSELGGTGLERHVFQWQLTVDRELGDGEQAAARIGQIATFTRGSLVGTTIRFDGWAELIDADAPEGMRLIGVLAEVCPATEDWPELGVRLGDWNLVEVLDPADRLGADPLAPIAGACFAGWSEFAIPLGVVATGFSAGDGADAVSGFAQWTFEGAAIAGPERE